MRKGISEIISSVLLLAIAISVAAVYSQWAPDYSKNTSKEISQQVENEMKCSNAAFDISEAEYDITGEIVLLKLSNKGTINFNNDITITAVNNSQIAGQKTIGSLEVEETQNTEIDSKKAPELLIASSQECPELKITEETIDIHK